MNVPTPPAASLAARYRRFARRRLRWIAALLAALAFCVLLDVSLAGFFLVYAFVFNWAYDHIYPVGEMRRPASNAAAR